MSNLQPSSRRCFVCGVENPSGLRLKFYNCGPGEVTADYTAPEHYQGYPGVVHGGIVAAMLDEAAGRSHMGGDPPRFMYTARLSISYRKNVPTGQLLRLVGHAGKSKGRTAMATSEIYDQSGTLLAEAEAVLVDVPVGVIANTDLDALGWKVYPDEETSL
ncbi:MAG: PaaI family thioesterase [Chloroflexota bacterium]|nr:MAG: PaaI family thioesterase [Chloroflexota bacterium]